MGIKYSVNEHFFSEWSPIMAYVLGYWYADGSVYPSVRGSYMNVTSTDKEIILKIKKWLQSLHTIREEKPTGPNRKTRFILRIGNKALYNSLLKLGIFPSKSLTVRLPKIPAEFIKHFVRGYFDGDGCVYLEMAKGITIAHVIKRLSIIFTSGSKRFLEELAYVLESKLKLSKGKVYDSHRSYQLKYNTTNTIKLFKLMYSDCQKEYFLKRKFDYFCKYFKLRSQRIDNDVREIIDKHGHVVK